MECDIELLLSNQYERSTKNKWCLFYQIGLGKFLFAITTGKKELISKSNVGVILCKNSMEEMMQPSPGKITKLCYDFIQRCSLTGIYLSIS